MKNGTGNSPTRTRTCSTLPMFLTIYLDMFISLSNTFRSHQRVPTIRQVCLLNSKQCGVKIRSFLNQFLQCGAPPVISWFINPINCSYKYNKAGLINQLSYLGGPTLYKRYPSCRRVYIFRKNPILGSHLAKPC